MRLPLLTPPPPPCANQLTACGAHDLVTAYRAQQSRRPYPNICFQATCLLQSKTFVSTAVPNPIHRQCAHHHQTDPVTPREGRTRGGFWPVHPKDLSLLNISGYASGPGESFPLLINPNPSTSASFPSLCPAATPSPPRVAVLSPVLSTGWWSGSRWTWPGVGSAGNHILFSNLPPGTL